MTRLVCVAGTMLLPIMLVAGLLAMPTTCRCGGERPHVHSSLALADHWHGTGAAPAQGIPSLQQHAPVTRSDQQHEIGTAQTWVVAEVLSGVVAETPTIVAQSSDPPGASATAAPDSRQPAPDPPPPRSMSRSATG